MYIRALKINNFRGLNELWFLPNKGINVLVGLLSPIYCVK